MFRKCSLGSGGYLKAARNENAQWLFSETFVVTLKPQVNVTPNTSIQYYAFPFKSVAKCKLAADTNSFTKVERFRELADQDLSFQNGTYTANLGSGVLPFTDPNFSFNEF